MIIFVAIGGAIGAVARWMITIYITKKMPFPAATPIINILGSLSAGFLLQVLFTEQVYLFLIVGFLGAFTTFSTLQLEGIKIIKNGETVKGLIYMNGILLISVAAAGVGFLLSTLI
ncbi:fluoride efflux transporter FluC [Jeotgalibacillus soli]|uniref:Fluoride-specific ion channel FluC n=1 Tax=Jeotgalibacillus soli TaxID=889306 RepID=A0A0C2VLU8_9BACL|nr:CrcB family protein [Jeotgalibacillus soli]KIL45441.1 hypothetical protein KP78_29850 [Jeotgalibacillus soli]